MDTRYVTLTWTTADGRATDLVYEVVVDRADPRVGAVHMTMVPHWDGPATVTDVIDGPGHGIASACGSVSSTRNSNRLARSSGVG